MGFSYELKQAIEKFQLDVGGNTDGTNLLRLTLKKSLDRETTAQHVVQIYAIDGGQPPLTGSITIQIDVTDSNDNSPKF